MLFDKIVVFCVLNLSVQEVTVEHYFLGSLVSLVTASLCAKGKLKCSLQCA